MGLGRGTAVLVALVIAGCAGLCLPAGAAADSCPSGATCQTGYIPVDGAALRYHVDLPAPDGRFPVALIYDGYCEGNGAQACGNDADLAADLLAANYAVLGVSIRGTSCSSGQFDFRNPVADRDGAAAVEWAARQPWSAGRVGMFGDSFPGLSQLGVAALHPKGLAAIAPFQVVDDPYREVAYPGGIFNYEFAAFWGIGAQPDASEEGALDGIQGGDSDCAVNHAGQPVANVQSNIFLQAYQHPFNDSYWKSKAIGSRARQIAAPTFGCVTWQDDEVGSLSSDALYRAIPQRLLWVLASNGFHGLCDWDPHRISSDVVRFFDRYVKGLDNNWEEMPPLRVWHDTQGEDDPTPSWVTTARRWPARTSVTALHLHSGGALDDSPPAAGEPPASYRYPSASPGTENGILFGQTSQFWKQPFEPGSALAFTTPRLSRDTELSGPASLDLWMTSTASDTDLQATVTEVRPDGQEVYVARGWLRASMRALDESRSTATAPYQTFAAADRQPLVPGQPTLARILIFPFDYVFRTGSRLRVVLDTPSQTGGWNFDYLKTPATNSVLTDPAHDSRFVFGRIADARALRPAAPCDTLLNQPCRNDPFAG